MLKLIRRVISTLLMLSVATTLPSPLHAQTQGAGLGNTPGPPMGQPFTLPAGVELGGPIVGESLRRCPDGATFQGPSRWVEVCVPLCNVTGAPVRVHFPGGLVILARSGEYQNGLLIHEVTVEVPPRNCTSAGGLPDQNVRTDEQRRRLARAGAIWVPLSTFCLNSDLVPAGHHSRHAFGPVTTDPRLRPLIARFRNHRIAGEDDVDTIQDAVYAVTENHDGASRRRTPRR